MNFTNVKRQIGEIWVDGTGQQVPRKYVSEWQKIEERKVNAIYNLAKTAWEQLRNKKSEIKKHADQLIKDYYKLTLFDIQQSHTFYNFNRTVMIEVEKVVSLEYDPELIEEASNHFKAYLDDQMVTIEPEIKTLIKSMILNMQKEKLALHKVKRLEQLGKKLNHPEMKIAIELIERAKKEGLARWYYRVRIKNNETDNYDLLDINFSAIDL